MARRACADLPPRPLVLDPACGDGRWLIAAGRCRPDARLVGVDVDPSAIAAARETCRRAGVDARLVVADALADPSPLPASDLVVGNPPFVRPQNLEPATRAELWARFTAATNKSDVYACFVERALATAPRIAVVLPDGWLHLESFAALRELVWRAGVRSIWTLPAGALPIPGVVLLTGATADRRAGDLGPDGVVDRGSVHADAHSWSLDGPLPQLVGRPLGEHASVHMGVVCGDYARYVHPGRRHPEDRPTCRGRDVRRWQIGATDEHLRYDPADMLARKRYVAPKHAGLFDLPEKIVLAGATGTELRAAMDEERRFPLDSCYVVLPRGGVDPWALLGLLLSGPVGRWYGARHRAVRVKGVELARIPLPERGWTEVAEAARARDDAGVDAAVERAYES